MTYLELLHSVKFDDIVPFIGKYHGHEDCMAWYKIHYDILCQMTPHREEGDKATATISCYVPDEDEKDMEHGKLTAPSLEGDLWEVALAKELVIEPDVKASLGEMAACCLWHTSYFGFTDSHRESYFRNEEDDALIAKRVIAKYGKYIPSKKQMLRNKSFHNKIRSEMKYFRVKPKKWEKSCYVMHKGKVFIDAKCCWRKWERIIIEDKYNSIISNIGEFIEELQRGKSVIAPPSVRELCQKLLWGKHCHNLSYQIYINDAPRRGEYFKELIVKYKAFTCAWLPCAVVCLISSSDYPVTMEEMQLVKLATQGCEEVRFCVKVDDNLAQELKISVTFYDN